jgi:hypothetical protein
MIVLPDGAGDYYNMEKAYVFLSTPVPEGYRRWICLLCGCPAGDWKIEFDAVGAYCCGGCGMSCVRPIEEWERRESSGY